jgi:fucose permease
MSIKKLSYKHTIIASYLGYVSQAIVVCFVPLLFVIFNTKLDISLTNITFLITLNFAIQFTTDALSPKIVDKIGYDKCIVFAHFATALGLILLGFLPRVLNNTYLGLLISVVIYAIGGGLIEVMISPIVEACPSDNKKSAMSLLHSFYSWGSVAVILFSTLFLRFVGEDFWWLLSIIWATVPFLNAVYFIFVPIGKLTEEGKSASYKELFSSKSFWLFILLMIVAGASEQVIAQWSSAFAEGGLKVSKTIGDILGPCMFAVMMGISRVLYAKFSEKIDLLWFITGSAVLCVFSYLLTILSPIPILSLVGCAICGLSVGIMWPGMLSIASAKNPKGGTLMFGTLALAGDMGCLLGPTLVGTVSGMFNDSLKIGLSFAIIFPVIMIIGSLVCRTLNNNKKSKI